MNKKNGLPILVALVLFGLLLSGCQGEKESTKTGDSGTEIQLADGITSDSHAEQVYEVGDIVSIDNTILVVLGWDLPLGGLQFPPEEGKKHLAVDVMVANQGEDTFEISPGYQMTLKDPSGQEYYMNTISGYISGSDKPDGEIIPGEIIRGKVGFQVPEDLENFVFIYELNRDGWGEISVNLGSTPVTMDPPTTLNLTLQQDIYQIGDLIEISNRVIQVIEVTYPAGNEIIKPKENYKFVVVDVQIENQGEDTQFINGPFQMYLKDSTGQKYSSDSGAESINNSVPLIDELQPGERIRGQIGFQVPEDEGGLIFVFFPDSFEYGKVFITMD